MIFWIAWSANTVLILSSVASGHSSSVSSGICSMLRIWLTWGFAGAVLAEPGAVQDPARTLAAGVDFAPADAVKSVKKN